VAQATGKGITLLPESSTELRVKSVYLGRLHP
jgi:hypothetical protein